MNLDLTPEQRTIRDESARFLQAHSSSAAIRLIVDAGGGTNLALWTTVSRELGWCAMAIPEEYGGLGLGATEVVILMELAGARLACMPIWTTVCLAAPLLLEVAIDKTKARYLPAIAAGELTATVALANIGSGDPLGGNSVKALVVDGGYVLEGHVPAVIDLDAAGLILVPANTEDGAFALFALEPSPDLEINSLKTLDATRPVASLTLKSMRVDLSARIDKHGVSGSSVAKALAFAQLGLAAEQLGTARGAMDLTLAYIADRIQFGRTIASFQAVKHRCAQLEVDFAEARALVYGTAMGLGTEASDETLAEISGARLLASELAFRAAEESIQLHGGVGFTWEYDPHLYFKRAQASAMMLGAPDAQLDLISTRLLSPKFAA